MGALSWLRRHGNMCLVTTWRQQPCATTVFSEKLMRAPCKIKSCFVIVCKLEEASCGQLWESGGYVTSHNERYFMSIFENYEIFAISKRELAFQWYQTFKNWTATFEVRARDGVYFLLFPLYFMSYFALNLKISFADIRYLSLWHITYGHSWWPVLAGWPPDAYSVCKLVVSFLGVIVICTCTVCKWKVF